jgi:hypothetical protein
VWRVVFECAGARHRGANFGSLSVLFLFRCGVCRCVNVMVCMFLQVSCDVTVCIGQDYESKAADVRAKQAARRGEAEAADGDAGDALVVKY